MEAVRTGSVRRLVRLADQRFDHERLDPGLVLPRPGVDADRVALVDEDRDLVTTRPVSVVAGLRAPGLRVAGEARLGLGRPGGRR